MQSRKPTVLVTGGTGYLGSAVVSLLKENEYDVATLSRRPSAVSIK